MAAVGQDCAAIMSVLSSTFRASAFTVAMPSSSISKASGATIRQVPAPMQTSRKIFILWIFRLGFSFSMFNDFINSTNYFIYQLVGESMNFGTGIKRVKRIRKTSDAMQTVVQKNLGHLRVVK